MEDEELRARLEKLDQDSIWLNEHYAELQRFQGKVIAIKEGKIIAVKESLEELLADLERKKEDPMFLLIQAIPPEDIAFIL
jgi:uncharacterized protein YlzI (FlbEa/FlbD family)